MLSGCSNGKSRATEARTPRGSAPTEKSVPAPQQGDSIKAESPAPAPTASARAQATPQISESSKAQIPEDAAKGPTPVTVTVGAPASVSASEVGIESAEPSVSAVANPTAGKKTTETASVKPETAKPAKPKTAAKAPASIEIIYFEQLSGAEAEAFLNILINADPLEAASTKEEKGKAFESLFEKVEKTRACELNTEAGSCVVLQRATEGEKKVDRVDLLASAPRLDYNGATGFVRQNLLEGKLKNKPEFKKDLRTLLGKRKDGVFVFSQAPDEASARAFHQKFLKEQERLQLETMKWVQREQVLTQPTAQADTFIHETERLIAERFQYDPRRTEKQKIDQIIKEMEAVQNQSGTEAIETTQALNRCYITATLERQKRLILINISGLLDYASEPLRVSKKFTRAEKERGKGNFLYCSLTSGVLQKVPLQIIEKAPLVQVGLVTSMTRERIFASGFGWANGATDIIRTREYNYFLKLGVGALAVGANMAPIVLSSARPESVPPGEGGSRARIFGGQIGFELFQPRFVDAELNLGGTYVIEIDPDET